MGSGPCHPIYSLWTWHGASCKEDARSFLNHVYVSEVESNHCLLFSAQKYLADGGLRFSGFGISFQISHPSLSLSQTMVFSLLTPQI